MDSPEARKPRARPSGSHGAQAEQGPGLWMWGPFRPSPESTPSPGVRGASGRDAAGRPGRTEGPSRKTLSCALTTCLRPDCGPGTHTLSLASDPRHSEPLGSDGQGSALPKFPFVQLDTHHQGLQSRLSSAIQKADANARDLCPSVPAGGGGSSRQPQHPGSGRSAPPPAGRAAMSSGPDSKARSGLSLSLSPLPPVGGDPRPCLGALMVVVTFTLQRGPLCWRPLPRTVRTGVGREHRRQRAIHSPEALPSAPLLGLNQGQGWGGHRGSRPGARPAGGV